MVVGLYLSTARLGKTVFAFVAVAAVDFALEAIVKNLLDLR